MRASPRLEGLLAEAEENGICCVPHNRNDQRLLERHAAVGEVLRLAPGIYARSSWWSSLNPLERHVRLARALALRHPDWIFCGPTAAALQELSPSYENLNMVHIIGRCSHSPTMGTYDAMPLQRHEISWPDAEVVNGIRVTSPARTAFDCMRKLSFANGLAIADAAVRKLAWSAQDLMDYVRDIARSGSSRGTAHAMVTASYADGRAESGGESIARAHMVRLGYAIPMLQLSLPNILDGENTYRVDFAWPRETGLLAGELDGKLKYTDPAMTNGRAMADVIFDEKMRESRINALDIPVMRMSFRDVTKPKRLDDILSAYGVPRAGDRMPVPTERPDCLERRRRCSCSLQMINDCTTLVERFERERRRDDWGGGGLAAS